MRGLALHGYQYWGFLLKKKKEIVNFKKKNPPPPEKTVDSTSIQFKTTSGHNG